jgi:hypothetical protein
MRYVLIVHSFELVSKKNFLKAWSKLAEFDLDKAKVNYSLQTALHAKQDSNFIIFYQ